MDGLLAEPFVLLVLAWLGSRFGTLAEVRWKVGPSFRFRKYLRLRSFQIAHGAFWTLATYGLLVAMGKADPEFAFATGIAADQIIERMTGVKARERRDSAVPGAAPGDITTIADEYRKAEEA